MLRRFHIKNFKSLVDFSLDEMGQFVCLTGLNGAGKTTVLQAIDFVAHLATGGLEQWFADREWNYSDIRSKLVPKKNIFFDVTLDLSGEIVRWNGSYNLTTRRCTSEEIFIGAKKLLSVTDQTLIWGDYHEIASEDREFSVNTSSFDYKGSILSLYKRDPFSMEDFQVKVFFAQVKSLELLLPNKMRSRSRTANDIGSGGQNLAGYLHDLKPAQKLALEMDLRKFYSNLTQIKTKKLRFGWAELNSVENFSSSLSDISLQTVGRHVNDGLLRILTIVTQVQTDRQFLLFDEIENGINPELVEQLMGYLLAAKQQIMVTTHNPVILNFLPDDIARKSVFFLYRTSKGETKATKFFDIPEVAEKLEILGPGEVFLDTSLTQLAGDLGRA